MAIKVRTDRYGYKSWMTNSEPQARSKTMAVCSNSSRLNSKTTTKGRGWASAPITSWAMDDALPWHDFCLTTSVSALESWRFCVLLLLNHVVCHDVVLLRARHSMYDS